MDLIGYYNMFKNESDKLRIMAVNDNYMFNNHISSYLYKIHFIPYEYKNKNRFEHYNIISQYYGINKGNMMNLDEYSSMCMNGHIILKRLPILGRIHRLRILSRVLVDSWVS
jgi:hypothetical protein